MIVVLMGVAGAGKSTIAAELHAMTGWEFAEGDEYHSAANCAKMAAGMALTDEDRRPWLETLHGILTGWQQNGSSGILTCSALKRDYRERLSQGNKPLHFVWLDTPQTTLERRLEHRTGHYFNSALLASQLDTLEPPQPEEGVIQIKNDASRREIARRILDSLQRS